MIPVVKSRFLGDLLNALLRIMQEHAGFFNAFLPQIRLRRNPQVMSVTAKHDAYACSQMAGDFFVGYRLLNMRFNEGHIFGHSGRNAR